MADQQCTSHGETSQSWHVHVRPRWIDASWPGCVNSASKRRRCRGSPGRRAQTGWPKRVAASSTFAASSMRPTSTGCISTNDTRIRAPIEPTSTVLIMLDRETGSVARSCTSSCSSPGQSDEDTCRRSSRPSCQRTATYLASGQIRARATGVLDWMKLIAKVQVRSVTTSEYSTERGAVQEAASGPPASPVALTRVPAPDSGSGLQVSPRDMMRRCPSHMLRRAD